MSPALIVFERLCYAVLAAIHLMPATTLFRPGSIAGLYRIEPQGPILPLLQHRAALFVIVVLACIWAALDSGVRQLATSIIAISMLSFLVIYWQAGSPPALQRIARADLLGLPFLALVVWRAWAFRPG